MNRISCLIIETDQEAIRHIDILGRTIGSLEVRWKTNSLETGVAIILKHLPAMAMIDLRAAAEKVYKLKAARMEKRPDSGRIVSVFSNKGGNGTTTIAVNLADALVRYHGKKVAVVDLVLSHGDVTMFFNVNPSYSILDLAKNAQKADYDFLHTLLVKHSSGVYILADPPMIEDAEQISAGHVKDVLNTLRGIFDYIVVDTPHQFDERTLTALEMSDT